MVVVELVAVVVVDEALADVVVVVFGTVVVVVVVELGGVYALAAQSTGRKKSCAVLPISLMTVEKFFTPGSCTTMLLPWVPMFGLERPSPFARACMMPTTVCSWVGRRLLGRLEDDREAAFEVEAELGRPSGGDDASEGAEAHEAHQDNTCKQATSQRLPPPLPLPPGWPSASSPGSFLSASRGGTEYGSLSASSTEVVVVMATVGSRAS